MASNAWENITPVTTAKPGFDKSAAITRSLLGYGMLVGPFYLVVGLVQGFVRDGFDFKRHALSHLANGAGGWVQTANFVLGGAMVIAAAIGIARMLRPQSRAAGWILGTFGASMLAAALFPADPVYGFPAGTPEGDPTTISTPGMLHFVSGATGFLALATSCIVVGFAMRRRGEPAIARWSFLAGVAVIAGFFGPMILPGPLGIAGIWFSVVVGWLWLALVSWRLYRMSPDPNCESAPA